MKKDERVQIHFGDDIPFPFWKEEHDEASQAMFIRRIAAQMLPKMQSDAAYLDTDRLSLNTACQIADRSFDALTLMWSGLLPEMRREFEQRLLGDQDFMRAFALRTKRRAKQKMNGHGR